MRTLVLAALAVVAFSLSPTSARPQPKEPDLATRVRELEERLAVVEKKLARPQDEVVPLGDVTVNLSEERLMRYLRLKIAFKVDAAAHRELTGLVAAKKAELRSWAITHLAGKSVKDVSGSAGVAKLQAELRDGFGKILQGDRKENPVREVLFEEYVVQ